MRTPVVSVVLPAYRSAEFVNQALDSIRAQTLTDIEIIIVDDCSPEECVRQYDIRDNVTLIRHVERQGPAAARNSGIRAARGAYIALMDMDDIWLPDKLESQVQLMKSDGSVGLVYCHYTLVDERLQPTGQQPRPKPLGDRPLLRLLKGNVIKSCSVVMIRRDALDRCGIFDESIVGTDDWDLWLRIASEFKVCSDPRPLVLYRTHSNQLSGDYAVMREGSIVVRERWLPWAAKEAPEMVPVLRAHLCHEYQRLSKQQARNQSLSSSIRTLFTAVRTNPRDLRSYLRFLAVGCYAVHPGCVRARAAWRASRQQSA
jgi:glycosyltransferase involved in cell wall biosynthesis